MRHPDLSHVHVVKSRRIRQVIVILTFFDSDALWMWYRRIRLGLCRSDIRHLDLC